MPKQKRKKNVETQNVSVLFMNLRVFSLEARRINGRNWVTNPCLMLAIYCILFLFFSRSCFLELRRINNKQTPRKSGDKSLNIVDQQFFVEVFDLSHFKVERKFSWNEIWTFNSKSSRRISKKHCKTLPLFRKKYELCLSHHKSSHLKGVCFLSVHLNLTWKSKRILASILENAKMFDRERKKTTQAKAEVINKEEFHEKKESKHKKKEAVTRRTRSFEIV